MLKLPASIERAILEFSKLPGIGPKSAQRLALYLLKKDGIDISSFSDAIAKLKEGVIFCSICHTMSDTDPCNICANSERDKTIICVVEEALDALAIDKTNQYNGVFHILGGVLNPLEGIGPDKLNLNTLQDRIANQGVTEVIIATNPSLEGETTAMHIAKLLKDSNIKLTRIARGLPMGGDLEYADEITLKRAMEGRLQY